MQASWLKLSKPVLTEPFVIVQDIGFQKTQEYDLTQNLNFGIQITTLFVSSCFCSLIFTFFLISTRKLIVKGAATKKEFDLKKVISSCLKIFAGFSHAPSSSVTIFILMFDLYLWLCMLMIINMTKTNKVVIIFCCSAFSPTFTDERRFPQVIYTSEIVKDAEDALNTHRTFCMLEDDTEFKVSCSKEHYLFWKAANPI